MDRQARRQNSCAEPGVRASDTYCGRHQGGRETQELVGAAMKTTAYDADVSVLQCGSLAKATRVCHISRRYGTCPDDGKFTHRIHSEVARWTPARRCC